MNKSILSARFILDDQGRLLPETQTDKAKVEHFKKNLESGQSVEVFMEANLDNGTLAQLAKVHACIRELADDTGNTFEDMKLYIKKKAGLCVSKEIDNEHFMVCKSFSVCSKKELSLVMEAIYEVADPLGINLR